VTAIGGGLIRDVLAGHKTLLMNRDLYAIPVTLGCVLYVLSLAHLPEHRPDSRKRRSVIRSGSETGERRSHFGPRH
jgi:hypothetical protein